MPYLEPNFHRNCLRVRKALGVKMQVKLGESEPLNVNLQSVTLLKGVSVYRNDNYSSDSYARDNSDEDNGIVQFSINKQEKEEYPEAEWFSSKKITARLHFKVRGGPSLEVYDGEQCLGSTKGVTHSVVVETELTMPPLNSEHQVRPEDLYF